MIPMRNVLCSIIRRPLVNASVPQFARRATSLAATGNTIDAPFDGSFNADGATCPVFCGVDMHYELGAKLHRRIGKAGRFSRTTVPCLIRLNSSCVRRSRNRCTLLRLQDEELHPQLRASAPGCTWCPATGAGTGR